MRHGLMVGGSTPYHALFLKVTCSVLAVHHALNVVGVWYSADIVVYTVHGSFYEWHGKETELELMYVI